MYVCMHACPEFLCMWVLNLLLKICAVCMYDFSYWIYTYMYSNDHNFCKMRICKMLIWGFLCQIILVLMRWTHNLNIMYAWKVTMINNHISITMINSIQKMHLAKVMAITVCINVCMCTYLIVCIHKWMNERYVQQLFKSGRRKYSWWLTIRMLWMKCACLFLVAEFKFPLSQISPELSG
jgi:hypothetical protein